MPVIRNVPDAKRRVRTGCLSCRKRRRKCDERKPQCGSCQERRVVCKYPDLTFIIGHRLGGQEAAAPPSDRPSLSYSSPRFVDRSSPTSRSIPSAEAPPTTQDARLPLHAEEPEPLTGPGRNIMDSVVETSRCQSKTVPPFPATHLPQSEWKDYFSTTHAASVKNETATLLHFQYNLAPWIEAGDLGSTFGTEVMLLAQKRRCIMSAISSAASSQLARSNSAYGASTMLRRDPDPSFALEEPRVRRIGLALLTLGDVFTLNPSQWRGLSFFQLDESIRNTNSFSGAGEPLETLLLFHSRIDLAASLLTDQPPLPSLGFVMSRDPADRALPLSTKSIYNACLIQLASCLHLLNGNSIASGSPPFFASATQGSPSSGAGSYFSSKWSSLWSNCQQWYHGRPVEMQPILEIRSVEAGQIDADSDSSFPIPVYTSSIALQCNIVYHISSRLLLQRKPRLLRLSSRQRHLSSLSWHAQQIAGIATRNDFAEQWDPILIAGLLWIARDMTHPSQQESLVSCFRQIASTTGIKLEEEIQALRARWTSSGSQHIGGYRFSG
ncbi:hypothetical protein J3F83DRAFT_456798 [Trichoderma novae-zelandiae]